MSQDPSSTTHPGDTPTRGPSSAARNPSIATIENSDALSDEALESPSLNRVLRRYEQTREDTLVQNQASVIKPSSGIELPNLKRQDPPDNRPVLKTRPPKPVSHRRTDHDNFPDDALEDDFEGQTKSTASLNKEQSQTKGATKGEDELERVRRRQMAYLEQRREKKRRKVFLHRLNRLVGVFYFFTLIATLWLLATQPFWTFNGQAFNLSNNRLLTTRHVQPFIDAYKGWSMYHIDPQALSHRIKSQYAIVDQVHVRRSLFPAALSLYVVEKQPFAELYEDASATVPYALICTDYSVVPLALYSYRPATTPDLPAQPTTTKTIFSTAQPKAVHTNTPIPTETSAKPATAAQPDPLTSPQLHSGAAPLHRNLVRLVMPSGAPPDRMVMERLRLVSRILHRVPDLHLQTIRVQPVPNSFPTVTARFAETDVNIGLLDAEAGQRTLRLLALTDKIRELQSEIQAVDLRWSEQITFIRKQPNGQPTSTNAQASPAAETGIGPSPDDSPAPQPLSAPTH